ncbi:MAG TPA: hypothetical protein VFO16_07405 [Pseudonocardiaceae bacterium]|nr:hypothetical protein [Pseudonocardiaceae bacterium]
MLSGQKSAAGKGLSKLAENRDHAVVIGASIAGLCAAQALASRFGRVTVVDRDEIGPETTFRRGAPQGYQPHFLLELGALTLERLFPGFRERLAAGGVPIGDFGTLAQFQFPSGYTPLKPTGVFFQTFSRPFLEWHLRSRLLSRHNVGLVGGFRVESLISEGVPSVVRGVRGRRFGERSDIYADLTVDATGRRSQTSRLVEGIGVTAVRERVVPADVSYTTRLYRGHPENGLHVFGTYPLAPYQRRGAGIVAIERDRCMVVMLAADGEPAPKNATEFHEFAKSLPNQFVSKYLREHSPDGDLHRFSERNNRWRLLHRCKDWPVGLAALGDSVCVFNPLYAQGMTVAALQAMALGECLDRGNCTKLYQKHAARIVRIPWLLATTNDLAWRNHQVPLFSRVASWYLRRIFDRVPADSALYRQFVRVQHMRSSPTSLLGVGTVARAFLCTERPSATPFPACPFASDPPTARAD